MDGDEPSPQPALPANTYSNTSHNHLVMTENPVYLRASPAVGIGGMYATAEGDHNPVKIAAQRPPFSENQKVRNFMFWSPNDMH